MTTKRKIVPTVSAAEAQANPLLYNQFRQRQPDYIVAYLEAFQKVNPTRPLPIVWSRRNGWVAYRRDKYDYEHSMRRSKLERITADMLWTLS